jgi:hypothetical protein
MQTWGFEVAFAAGVLDLSGSAAAGSLSAVVASVRAWLVISMLATGVLLVGRACPLKVW